MPARDIYHDTVKNALIKDGWTITHDPFVLRWGTIDVCIDLGAEQLLAAERQGLKIAVEVKSFVGRSDVDDLEKALGQYILYHDVLSQREPERVLYLAVHEEVFLGIFEEAIGKLLLENQRVKLIVFDRRGEDILRWIP
ncbi:MAG: XisH family protein [Candidatus Entotheonellia bacterium]